MIESRSSARRDMPDLLAGVVLAGLGALGLWAGRDLSYGSPAMMGPGFLPLSLAWMLVGIGSVVFVNGLRRPRLEIGELNIRPLIILVIAIAGFAFGAHRFGFVLSSAWLLVVGSLADAEHRWKEIAISSVLLVAFGTAVFIYGLGVQMPVWPTF
jgi:hypothetical protein